MPGHVLGDLERLLVYVSRRSRAGRALRSGLTLLPGERCVNGRAALFRSV